MRMVNIMQMFITTTHLRNFSNQWSGNCRKSEAPVLCSFSQSKRSHPRSPQTSRSKPLSFGSSRLSVTCLLNMNVCMAHVAPRVLNISMDPRSLHINLIRCICILLFWLIGGMYKTISLSTLRSWLVWKFLQAWGSFRIYLLLWICIFMAIVK